MKVTEIKKRRAQIVKDFRATLEDIRANLHMQGMYPKLVPSTKYPVMHFSIHCGTGFAHSDQVAELIRRHRRFVEFTCAYNCDVSFQFFKDGRTQIHIKFPMEEVSA